MAINLRVATMEEQYDNDDDYDMPQLIATTAPQENQHIVQNPILNNWQEQQQQQQTVQLTALPHCFHSTLLSTECEKAESSDGIYLSNDLFRTFNGTDSDEMVIIRITNATNNRSTYAHILGTHSEDRNAVFMPPWMFQILRIDCADAVHLSQYRDCKIGLNIRIQPHESFYATLPDPVAALRDAFESYTVLQSGTQIALLVAGRQLSVSIVDTNSIGPICIRGMELEVTIDTPLDQPTNSIVDQEQEQQSQEQQSQEQQQSQDYPDEEIDFSCMFASMQRAKERFLKPQPLPLHFPGVARTMTAKNKIN